jgi:hypothetical protein
MKKTLLFLVVLALMPAAIVLASGKQAAGTTAAAGSQATPVTFMTNMGHEASDEVWQRIHDYIEQQTGVKFIFRDAGDADTYGTQLTTAIAAEEPIDAFTTSSVEMTNFKAQGVIQDLTDAIKNGAPNMVKLFTEAPGWDGLRQGDMWRSVSIDGRYWAVPGATGKNTGVVIQIRKDWREKLGLPPVTTIEEFERYLRAVKTADLDGNGQADTIPYLDFYGEQLEGTASTLVYPYVGMYGWQHEWYNTVYLDSATGNLMPTVLHPRFKDFLAKQAQWYKEGLHYADVITSSWDANVDLVAANRVAAVSSWYSDFYSGWETLVQKVPDAQYEVVVLKKVDGGPAAFALNAPAQASWVYTAWSKNVSWGIKLQDWFAASKDNYIVQIHGVPSTDWSWVNKDTNELKKTDDSIYAYSFLGYNPWNGVPTNNTNFGAVKRREATKVIATYQAIYPPDWYSAFDSTGMPNYVDAATFINESIANVVLGRSTMADWDRAVAQYKSMWADEFVRQATAAYKQASM